MATKKDLIIAVLSTFCLTSTLFMILPIGSSPTYDIWTDYNNDGVINMRDITQAVLLFNAQATGNEARNVNVTNWPLQEEYNVLNYEYRARSLNFEEHHLYGPYRTNSSIPVAVVNFTIDATPYTSTLYTLCLNLFCVSHTQTLNTELNISLWCNGVLFWSGTGGYSYFAHDIDVPYCLNTSRIDNEIQIQIHRISSDEGNWVEINDVVFSIVYIHLKSKLTSEDFGFQTVYIRSLTLDPGEAVILNNNHNQFIQNYGDTTVTYEFSEKIVLKEIKMVSGTPEITLLAKVE